LGDPNCSNTSAQIMTDPIVNPSALTSNTPDQVTIPANGSWHQVTNGSPWNIYEDSDWTAAVTGSDGFFGGDAVLSLKILDSSGNTLVPEQDYKFRIAGENPDPTTAKNYLTYLYGGPSATQALSSNPHAWFAWAIAKDETQGEGGSGYYNHFMGNGDLQAPGTHGHWRNTGNPWPGHEGRPNWNDDGTRTSGVTDTDRQTGSGGYGLFQLTYASRNSSSQTADATYIEPRNWIWNWEANAVAFGTELAGHITDGQNFATTLTTNYPHNGALPPTPDGIFSGVDSIIVTEYNGMHGGQIVPPKNKQHKPTTWILLNGVLRPSCWVPVRGGWQFLQNKEQYEANVGAIIHKGN